MSSKEKALLCAQAAIDKKAENTKILDVSAQSDFTDCFVICSAMSDRQVQAIAESIQSSMKGQGHPALSSEGISEGRWVLLDFGDIVVHIFLDALRDYYDLEGIWSQSPRIEIPQDYYFSNAH